MNNSYLLITVTLAYAGYNLFIKLAGAQNINNNNGIAATLCLQIFALIVTSFFSIYLSSLGENIFVLPSKTYLYAVFGGISIGIAEIGYFYLFNASNTDGALNANTAIPIILGGTILVTMIFSFYILKESFNYHKIIGTIFIIIGIYLIFNKK
ncbi:MAG: EamA family transporter [bacterium]